MRTVALIAGLLLAVAGCAPANGPPPPPPLAVTAPLPMPPPILAAPPPAVVPYVAPAPRRYRVVKRPHRPCRWVNGHCVPYGVKVHRKRPAG